MIRTITLNNVLPDIFRGRTLCSDIWNQNISFHRGESYLIEAQSGTGKSSLCAFVNGYRKDYSGTIFLDDRDILLFNELDYQNLWTTEWAVMFQDMRLFPQLTAYENVCIKNQLTHYRTKEWIKQAFDYLGIADKFDQSVSILSLGQQQRVAFIRMLCQPASFCFLDEPISHLDDYNATIMAQLLQEEIRQTGIGVIVTSVGKNPPMHYTGILHL